MSEPIEKHFARVVTERNAAYAVMRQAAMLLADAVLTRDGDVFGDLRGRTLDVYRALFEIVDRGELEAAAVLADHKRGREKEGE